MNILASPWAVTRSDERILLTSFRRKTDSTIEHRLIECIYFIDNYLVEEPLHIIHHFCICFSVVIYCWIPISIKLPSFWIWRDFIQIVQDVGVEPLNRIIDTLNDTTIVHKFWQFCWAIVDQSHLCLIDWLILNLNQRLKIIKRRFIALKRSIFTIRNNNDRTVKNWFKVKFYDQCILFAPSLLYIVPEIPIFQT